MQYIRDLKKYHWPKGPQDAVRLMMQEPCAEIIAGGTELLVSGLKGKEVNNLIDITKAGLSYIKKERKSIKIGATTTISELQHAPLLKDYAGGILSEAARKFVSVQIRNVATIGGNIGAAMPSSDLAPVLMALDAKICVLGKENKEFAINGFYISKRKTAMAPYEIITEIELPLGAEDGKTGYAFKKIGRTEMDIALVNGASAITINDSDEVVTARLSLGSVAPNTIRCLEIENNLLGKKLTKESIAAACDNIAKSIDPKTDVRASAKYRGTIAKVIAARLIEEAYIKAGGKI